eukprot:jgi/Ulvmu1/1887/UM012_0044.1
MLKCTRGSSYDMKAVRLAKLSAQPVRARCQFARGTWSERRACSTRAEPEQFTITTPLYYANAEPHMGGAYSTIAADVAARFQRLQGKSVTFVTGTDEHGEKIADSAEKAGVSPQEHCDRIAQRYHLLWDMLDISYDRFVRTTDARHEAVVRVLLARVWEADVRKATYRGRYCVGCEEYKDDDDLDEDGNCLVHRTPCPEREEENYFFQLSKYDAEVRAFCDAPGAVMPERARNEVLRWIADGCRDFSISRTTVDWGIRVPQDPSHTVYVWFDALIGYLSALLPDGGGDEATADALRRGGWPASVHVIGKDILRFHAVYWPGMLLAMGLPLPGRVYGHGFLTKDGLKMGKSLGNVLDPFELTEEFGADAVRFFFMREVVFGQDGDFAEGRFRDTVNAALANDIGNLCNRCLGLLKKNCDSTFPAAASDVPADHPLRETAAAAVPAAAAAYEELAFHEAIASALSISGRANRLLEDEAPWTALKKGSDAEKAAAGITLVAALEAARIVAVLLAPVVPQLSQRLLAQLGLPALQQELLWERDAQWGGLQAGATFPKPKPVFQRIEDPAAEGAKLAAAA